MRSLLVNLATLFPVRTIVSWWPYRRMISCSMFLLLFAGHLIDMRYLVPCSKRMLLSFLVTLLAVALRTNRTANSSRLPALPPPLPHRLPPQARLNSSQVSGATATVERAPTRRTASPASSSCPKEAAPLCLRAAARGAVTGGSGRRTVGTRPPLTAVVGMLASVRGTGTATEGESGAVGGRIVTRETGTGLGREVTGMGTGTTGGGRALEEEQTATTTGRLVAGTTTGPLTLVVTSGVPSRAGR